MSGSNRQILELFKAGLTAPEIAQSLGYEVEAVEFVLKNDSEIQTEIEKAEINKLESEFEQLEKLAFTTVKSILQSGDKDSARLAAAAYVLDQRLGLKKPKSLEVTFKISDFNDRLKLVKQRREQLEQECIDVESKLVAA